MDPHFDWVRGRGGRVRGNARHSIDAMSEAETKAVEALVSVLMTSAPEVAAHYKYGELRGRCRAFLRRLKLVKGKAGE
jgi:hypothetical protein